MGGTRPPPARRRPAVGSRLALDEDHDTQPVDAVGDRFGDDIDEGRYAVDLDGCGLVRCRPAGCQRLRQGRAGRRAEAATNEGDEVQAGRAGRWAEITVDLAREAHHFLVAAAT